LLNQICERLAEKGFASTNVVLGIGSYTYQFNTRDTFGFAVKATWCQVNGIPYNIFKDPITDDGTKKSAKGLIRIELENGDYVYYDEQTPEQEVLGLLQTVFLNGRMTKETTLAEIRSRVSLV
jgi:nicotinamide phosphoribosyltransferase